MNINSSNAVSSVRVSFSDTSVASVDKKAENRFDFTAGSRFSEFNLELFGQTNDNLSTQSGLLHLLNNSEFDVSTLQYNGRSILDLSPEEAADLVSEEGFYGVKNTAERLSGFVINGAGDDLDKIRAGRAGIIRGFKEAEELWGEKLPEISYDTLELALQQIDARIQDLGGSVINTEV
jgi:hypothetical protein